MSIENRQPYVPVEQPLDARALQEYHLGITMAITNNPDLVKDPGFRRAALDAAIFWNRKILEAHGVSQEDIERSVSETRKRYYKRNGILNFLLERRTIYQELEEKTLTRLKGK